MQSTGSRPKKAILGRSLPDSLTYRTSPRHGSIPWRSSSACTMRSRSGVTAARSSISISTRTAFVGGAAEGAGFLEHNPGSNGERAGGAVQPLDRRDRVDPRR